MPIEVNHEQWKALPDKQRHAACPEASTHGNPFRYCGFPDCGWMEEAPAKGGAELIADERRRQVNYEGYSPEHDAEHTNGEMVDAAWCYARVALCNYAPGNEHAAPAVLDAPSDWPWYATEWKPDLSDPVRMLVKAGALIAAEVDRLQQKP